MRRELKFISTFLLTWLVFIFGIALPCNAQQAKEYIEKLSSPSFHGRGYYKMGDDKAAKYIQNEFSKAGLLPVNGTYLQKFSFPVNTFPGKMDVKIGKQKLVPGKDFIVSPACPTIKGTYPVIKLTWPLPDFTIKNYANDFLLVDKSNLDSTAAAAFDELLRNPPPVKGVVVVEPAKLTWGVSGKVNDQVFIRVLKDSFPANATTITLNIENKFIKDYVSANVMGMIPGTTNADSFLVFTAHYDHLGRMGKNALFAGANDNASGTAMIMELAKYYLKEANRTGKSLLFIAFAAEEAGLIGSKFYTENPPLALNKIRFLLNLDLMGNGEDGMMVVNGEVHESEYQLLQKINSDQNLLKTIGKRGKARNSDHYWFSERGVPAFFFYTTGGSKAYHDIYDVAETLPLTEFEDVQTLIREFVKVLGN